MKMLLHPNTVKINSASLRTLMLLIASYFVCAPSHALEFFCATGSDERFIRMELPGQEHLCEVTVTNKAEERSVMWYADNDSMFCSAKAYELRDKYVDQWKFECANWPDTDGIDKLSQRQRSILDEQLKKLTEMGKAAQTPFQVTAVKTAASTAISDEPGVLALQFFITSESNPTTSDLTYLIVDDGTEWRITSTIDGLANLVDQSDEYKISTALVSSISDTGALEIMTSVVAASDDAPCQGSQVIHASEDGEVITQTPHRYVCG